MTNDKSNKQNLPEKDVVLKDVEISNDSVVSENASEKGTLSLKSKACTKSTQKPRISSFTILISSAVQVKS